MKYAKRFGVLLLLLTLLLTPLCGNRPVLVVSGSMEPNIKTGALTIVHFCDVKDCREGDIVTYYSPDFEEYITHRVVAVGDDYLITRGDANRTNDPTPVIDGMLYGKMVVSLNFLAPLFKGFIRDRTLDRGAMLGAVLTGVVALGLLVATLASIFTRAYVAYEIYSGNIDSEEEKAAVADALTAIYAVKYRDDISLWKRVRLYIAYSHMAKSAEEVSALLHKYIKE